MSSNSPSIDDADEADDADDASGATLSRRALLGTAAATATAGLAGCAGSFIRVDRAETTVERRFDPSDVSHLRVADAADDVTVERTGGDGVVVRAHKRAFGETDLSDLVFTAEAEDDTLHLESSKPPVVGIGGGSVGLEVRAPESVTVDHVETSDGDVVLRETTGDSVVQTGDGDVVARGLRGGLSASTGDGDVTVQGAGGPISIDSGDGDVAVQDSGRIAGITTADGDVVTGIPSIEGTTTVRTADGDVTVALGDSLDATVSVKTGDGDITIANALDEIVTSSEHSVTGTVGAGTNDLRIRTGDGDVTVTGL